MPGHLNGADNVGAETSVALRVRLNQLLRGAHVTKPIVDPRLTMKIVEPDRSEVSGSVGQLLSDEVISILSDKDGYARVLTAEEAEAAKSILRALKAQGRR